MSKPSEVYSDEKVKEMLETWDIVNCTICDKPISILKAYFLKGEFFICVECLKEMTNNGV